MGSDTKIEWADDTVNAWWGCTKVSPGCAHCYADGMGARFGVQWGDRAERRLRVEAAIRELVRIANRGDREGRPRRVFMQSMSDLFEDRADLRDPRARVFGALQAINQDRVRLIPMLLTKRAEHMVAEVERLGLPPGAWVGVSVENQAAADERIPHLLRVPAAVRFLSMEPLLGAVDLRRVDVFRSPPWPKSLAGEPTTYLDVLRGEGLRPSNFGVSIETHTPSVSWVIVGGESGPRARPMHPAWARSLRDQCVEAGVPFFFKQWGEWGPVSSTNYGPGPHRLRRSMFADGRVLMESINADRDKVLDADGLREWHADRRTAGHSELHYQWMELAGKHAAGRLLDGREWSEVPDAG